MQCVEGPRVKFANRVEEEHVTAKVEANVSGDEVLKDERVLHEATIGKYSCTIV